MNYKITFLKEFGSQFTEKIFRLVIGIYLIKEISQLLGPEKYGGLLYIESNYLMLLGISMMGFEPFFIKVFVMKKEFKKYLFNGILTLVTVSLLLLMLFQFYLIFYSTFKFKIYLQIISILILFNPLYFSEYYLNSKYKIRHTSFYRIMAFSIASILKLLAVHNNFSIEAFVWILIIENLIILIFYLIFFYKNFKFKLLDLKFDFDIVKEILEKSGVIFIYGVGMNLFARIDIFIIERYLGLSDLGNYSASFKLISFSYFLPILLANTFYTKILNTENNDVDTIKKMYFLSFWFSIFIYIGFLIFGNNILDLLFGDEFKNVKEIFKISSISLITVGLSATYIKRIYSLGLQQKLLLRISFTIFIDIILNIILVPIYGVIGVSISTVISVIITEVFYDFFIKELRKEHLLKIKSIHHYKWLKEYIN